MSFKDMAREFMHHVPLAKFHPVLLTCLKEYDSRMLSRDISAGLTVGMVALPLAMAFGIASGVPPESGLYTAIIAGFLISLLGGCRVQIGGPAGAFVVIIYGIIAQYGLSNLMLATLGSGVILFLMGLFKIGGFIKFIPVSIVIGFTNGIAVMIGLQQVKDFLGLTVAKMPADFFGQVNTIINNIGTINPWGSCCFLCKCFLSKRLSFSTCRRKEQLDRCCIRIYNYRNLSTVVFIDYIFIPCRKYM